MKKRLLAALAALAAVAIIAAALRAAYNAGIRHAVTDSELWILERGDDPEIYILLDNNTYVHAGYTG